VGEAGSWCRILGKRAKKVRTAKVRPGYGAKVVLSWVERGQTWIKKVGSCTERGCFREERGRTCGKKVGTVTEMLGSRVKRVGSFTE